MVVLHNKKPDLNKFLYKGHSQVKIDDLINEVCESKLRAQDCLLHKFISQLSKKLLKISNLNLSRKVSRIF
jgi:hypothetical protein